MAAIRAEYSDVKLIKTRKVFQLIFEIPIEEADRALAALGGLPRADAGTWVGIAPLTEAAATAPPQRATEDKPKKRMSELSRAQQAGILCNESQFQQWMFGRYGNPDPKNGVRTECSVSSRAELDTNEAAGMTWDTMRTEYDVWRGAIAPPER